MRQPPVRLYSAARPLSPFPYKRGQARRWPTAVGATPRGLRSQAGPGMAAAKRGRRGFASAAAGQGRRCVALLRTQLQGPCPTVAAGAVTVGGRSGATGESSLRLADRLRGSSRSTYCTYRPRPPRPLTNPHIPNQLAWIQRSPIAKPTNPPLDPRLLCIAAVEQIADSSPAPDSPSPCQQPVESGDDASCRPSTAGKVFSGLLVRIYRRTVPEPTTASSSVLASVASLFLQALHACCSCSSRIPIIHLCPGAGRLLPSCSSTELRAILLDDALGQQRSAYNDKSNLQSLASYINFLEGFSCFDMKQPTQMCNLFV